MKHIRRWFWSIFSSLLVIVVGLAWMAWYLPPTHFWWMALLAVALPYLAVGVALLWVFHLMRRSWTWVGILGVLLLLVGMRVFYLPVGGTGEPIEEETLALMTYNFAPLAHLGTKPAEELHRLKRLYQPDIWGFQESTLIYRPDHLDGTASLRSFVQSGAYAVHWPKGIQRHITFTQPVLVGPDVRVWEVEQLVFPTERSERYPSKVTRVRFTWQGRSAVLYNVHLRSFGSRKPWWEGKSCWLRPDCWLKYAAAYRQAYQSRAWEVEWLKAQLAKERLPVIIIGDFNSSPYNWSYRQLAEGRLDAIKEAGVFPGFTYHRRLPFVRIDFILVDPSFEVVSAQVPAGQYSDHLPVIAWLRWRK